LAAQKIYIKLSVNDFTIKAAALALRKVPAVTEAVIRQYTDIDISVAVATANGLITPIVRKADVKTLVQISAEMKGMAQRARDGPCRRSAVRWRCSWLARRFRTYRYSQ
jgi:pyruvate/2-oxoglutarate dehydrogenase complex dihydrolipoamide acyltransferase (E2) component